MATPAVAPQLHSSQQDFAEGHFTVMNIIPSRQRYLSLVFLRMAPRRELATFQPDTTPVNCPPPLKQAQLKANSLQRPPKLGT